MPPSWKHREAWGWANDKCCSAWRHLSRCPLIITGLRLASVQVIATATLGGLFGFNGLGSYIFEGFAQQDDGKLITGAVSVALLAIGTDFIFSVIMRRATPWLTPKRDLDLQPPISLPL